MKKIRNTIILLSILIISSSYLFAAEEHNIKSDDKDRGFRYDVIVMNRKSESRKKTDRNPVVFTHLAHTTREKCDTCHPAIFASRRGANNIDMQQNSEGKFCGKCHNGRKAWSLLECETCHSGDPVGDENAVRYAE